MSGECQNIVKDELLWKVMLGQCIFGGLYFGGFIIIGFGIYFGRHCNNTNSSDDSYQDSFEKSLFDSDSDLSKYELFEDNDSPDNISYDDIL